MSDECTADRHGDTYHAYNKWKCRCPGAREAKRAHAAKWNQVLKERRRDGVKTRKQSRFASGTIARLAEYQELRDMGFSHEYALRDIGWKHETYLDVTSGRRHPSVAP